MFKLAAGAALFSSEVWSLLVVSTSKLVDIGDCSVRVVWKISSIFLTWKQSTAMEFSIAWQHFTWPSLAETLSGFSLYKYFVALEIILIKGLNDERSMNLNIFENICNLMNIETFLSNLVNITKELSNISRL